MHRLCTFESPVRAWYAAVALWRGGIPARIYQRMPDVFDASHGFGVSRYDVMIAGREDAEEALLTIQAAEQDAAEQQWEEPAAPDLSKLDPSLQPPCPGCQRLLPLRVNLGKCPSCGRAVDVVEELVARHGPEALANCYGDPGHLIDEDLLVMAAVPCPTCEYALNGLPSRGRCPECGQPYDKAEIVQGWLG